jgi:hypothetical protein
MELPSDRPAGAHSAELTQLPAPDYRRLCQEGHGYECDMYSYQQPQTVSWFMRSPPHSRWIASREGS